MRKGKEIKLPNDRPTQNSAKLGKMFNFLPEGDQSCPHKKQKQNETKQNHADKKHTKGIFDIKENKACQNSKVEIVIQK